MGNRDSTSTTNINWANLGAGGDQEQQKKTKNNLDSR